MIYKTLKVSQQRMTPPICDKEMRWLSQLTLQRLFPGHSTMRGNSRGQSLRLLCWGNEAECLWRQSKLKFLGQSTMERSTHRENPRNIQKVLLDYVAEYLSVHTCEETTQVQKKNQLRRLKSSQHSHRART